LFPVVTSRRRGLIV